MVRQFDQRSVLMAPNLDVRRNRSHTHAVMTNDVRAHGAQVRVMLIAIHHDPEPPIFLGPHILQRLQAKLAAPNDASASTEAMQQTLSPAVTQSTAQPVETHTLPAPARLLPQMHDLMQDSLQDMHQALQPRLVRGEILSDQAGRLYERCGHQIKSLHRVASGPHGEVLELLPFAPRVASWEAGALCQPPKLPIHEEGPRIARPIAVPQPSQPIRPAVVESTETQSLSAPPQTQSTLPAESPLTETKAPDESAALKKVIPEQWHKPWEFRLSREEVLYDLQQEVAGAFSMMHSVHKLKRRWSQREAFRKWQSLLAGKSPDEQLWHVRPPAGQCAHPQVREWAQQMLMLAGYDVRVMLLEWEIFWRRKAL